MESELLRDYSDIIAMTLHQYLNYNVIDFQKFLFRKLQISTPFLTGNLLSAVKDSFINKYPKHKERFKLFGKKKQMEWSYMTFYQVEVGISGPRNTGIDEPVSVLKFDNKYILWDGYHRALHKIHRGIKTTDCYILEFPTLSP
jgi:hypothetical protein